MEAEVELLELLSYKPVFSRGTNCIFHMHTLAVDCSINNIMSATEFNSSGEPVAKENPKFIRSFAKARVLIRFKEPVPLEKFEVLPALG